MSQSQEEPCPALEMRPGIGDFTMEPPAPTFEEPTVRTAEDEDAHRMLEALTGYRHPSLGPSSAPRREALDPRPISIATPIPPFEEKEVEALCENCLFYEPSSMDPEVKVTPREPSPGGRCRRFPPSVTIGAADLEWRHDQHWTMVGDLVGAQPYVVREDWCGEWRIAK